MLFKGHQFFCYINFDEICWTCGEKNIKPFMKSIVEGDESDGLDHEVTPSQSAWKMQRCRSTRSGALTDLRSRRQSYNMGTVSSSPSADFWKKKLDQTKFENILWFPQRPDGGLIPSERLLEELENAYTKCKDEIRLELSTALKTPYNPSSEDAALMQERLCEVYRQVLIVTEYATRKYIAYARELQHDRFESLKQRLRIEESTIKADAERIIQQLAAVLYPDSPEPAATVLFRELGMEHAKKGLYKQYDTATIELLPDDEVKGKRPSISLRVEARPPTITNTVKDNIETLGASRNMRESCVPDGCW